VCECVSVFSDAQTCTMDYRIRQPMRVDGKVVKVGTVLGTETVEMPDESRGMRGVRCCVRDGV